jgi:Alr-MurF fusion protein
MILFSQLQSITGGTPLLAQDEPVKVLSIDSRKTIAQEGVVFFAIKGERHDGHKHLKELYKKGVRQFVVETDTSDREYFSDSNILQVESSVDALQKIAAFHRHQFSLPVIGITGSNGKTIIKEWLHQMLSQDKIVVKNPGSYNSQVGVPLSVWQIQDYHQIGIFEAGISKPGEMVKLEKIIQPTYGIFTNIGSAHDEGFESTEQKIKEKLQLFNNVTKLIYCKDQHAVDEVVSKSTLPSFTWGKSIGADIQVEEQERYFLIRSKNREFKLTIPFTDKASIENCLHCVTMMLLLDYTPDIIQKQVDKLRAVKMRLELKEAVNFSYVIDDTYNNDLGGLEISLQFLSHQQQKKNKTLILSDIFESGLPESVLAQQVAQLVKKNNVNKFIGIGPLLYLNKNLFPTNAIFYQSTEQFLADLQADQFQHEVILVKGARTFAFEKIVSRLQRKVHGTIMEIDLGALVYNFNFFKARLKPSTKVMVMVKAFAYGSGSNEIANLLQYHQADYLGVAYTDEGIELRKNNITLPIMVMNPSEDSFDQIITYSLEPEIYSIRLFRKLIAFLQGKACKIHLKLDTGMHRLGFEEGQIEELISLLSENKNIEVASIFTHLAGADDSQHDSFSKTQADGFFLRAEKISKALGYQPLFHLLNSPGILRLTHLQADMVRLGIGLYGVDPTTEGFKELKPVATLKTVISQIKHIRKGESVGYGRRGLAEKDLVLGTIAIGYADGFNRAFSRGVGSVVVRGVRCPVVGNVCMDMTMIDLTETRAIEGDEVIIFGKEMPINEVAASIQTIPYEILTNTSERVKRVFIAESI